MLMAVAEQPEPTVRSAAIDALGSIGPKANAAIPVLKRLLQERDAPAHANIAVALYRIDRREAHITIPVFIAELQQSDSRVRWHGLVYLQKMINEAKEAIPVPLLIDALSDSDVGVRGMASWILGETGPRAEQAVPALIKALGADDLGIRSAAAPALVKILASEATMAIPVLISVLIYEDDDDVRREILRRCKPWGLPRTKHCPLYCGWRTINLACVALPPRRSGESRWSPRVP